MNEITFPLKQRIKGWEVGELQAALQLLLEQSVLLGDDPATRRKLVEALVEEFALKTYGSATR